VVQARAPEHVVPGGLPTDARFAAWLELSAPIVAAFRPWLKAQLSRIPRSSKLAEDIRYILARFLEDGRLELAINPAENQDQEDCSDPENRPLRRALCRRREPGIARQPDCELQEVRHRSGQLSLGHAVNVA